MKRINLLYGLFIAFLLPACYDDLGSYDYHEINEIEVDSILSRYNCDADDSLCIYPSIRGNQYSDTSRFTYEWEIGRETVATTHDLQIVVNMLPGYKFSRFIVKDKETGVKKYYTFHVNVSSSTAGDLLMVFSKYEGRAELSYLRLDKEANWVVNYYQDRFGSKLGTNPQQLGIIYTQLAKAYPFCNASGQLMVLADDQIRIINKQTLMPDTVTPYLTGDAYTGLSTYPPADVSNYKPQFIDEGLNEWRIQTFYNTTYYNNAVMQISGGTLYYAFLGSFGLSFAYNVKSPYKGSLCPFGYWDDMTNTESKGTNKNMGYEVGDFILFDRTAHRFLYSGAYGGLTSSDEADVKAFPDYDNFQWGSATNITDNTSIAVLNNGSICRMLMFQKGTNSQGSATKKLIKDIAAGSVVTPETKFYMMKYNENLFFATGDKLYRYNVLNLQSGIAPNESNLVLKLSDYGYDANAKITSMFVSRTEKTLFLGISRYGSDEEANGEEAKGDILWFELNSTTLQLTHRPDKSAKGISGIPVEVKVKYQTHWRDGLNTKDQLVDNI